MMESILDSLATGGTACPLLDLPELDEGDFLSNVPFPPAEQMDELSSDFFSSFFEEQLLERPLLAERASLLHLELDSSPDIQAEHSYSLSEDSAPQSPALSIKMDQDSEFEWGFTQDLSAILVKEEEPDIGQRLATPTPEDTPMCLSPTPPHRGSVLDQAAACLQEGNHDDIKPLVKDEPTENGPYICLSTEEGLLLPPTPPSSSESDGSLPPSPPQDQHRPAQRSSSSSSSAISSSPLLTAPHKLQGSGPLLLTEEEKRTLVAEGYPVPNKLPLSKSEEKALKRVRRKIKNKISAQESRRKKKEYVECLEKKVECFTSENSDLWRKVENLETANRSLLQQLHKLQSLVSGKIASRCKMASTQTGTCLLMVALCFVLVLGSFTPCLPPLSSPHPPMPPPLSSSPPPLPLAELYSSTQVRSRSLLFYEEGSPLEESRLTEGDTQPASLSLQPRPGQGGGPSNHSRPRQTSSDGGMEYL